MALQVTVSIAPLQSLVAPMLPAGSEIAVALPSNASPHSLELPPSRVAAAFESDLLLFIGGGADPVMSRIALRRPTDRPSVSLVDAANEENHDHAGHDHSSTEAHAWLDPHLVELALNRIAESVRTIHRRQHGSDADDARVRAGLAAVRRDVHEVSTAYDLMLRSMPPTRFISVHGAFDAVLEEYGLQHVRTIQPSHEVELTPGALFESMDDLQRGDTILIIEDNVNEEPLHALIQAAGPRVARLRATSMNDWEAMMRANLSAIIQARSSASP